jgi:hypothetical protein
MPETNLVALFTERLNTLGARYMVTGSVAGTVYGEPRLTQDVDLVLELPVEKVDSLRHLFPAEQFYCPPEQVIRVEVSRPMRGHFNLIHFETGFKADVYLAARDPLHLWALPLARKMEIGGQPLWVAPPEYVIVRKLQFFKEGGSEKHLRDIRSIVALSATGINFTELKAKIEEYGLLREWQLVQQP